MFLSVNLMKIGVRKSESYISWTKLRHSWICLVNSSWAHFSFATEKEFTMLQQFILQLKVELPTFFALSLHSELVFFCLKALTFYSWSLFTWNAFLTAVSAEDLFPTYRISLSSGIACSVCQCSSALPTPLLYISQACVLRCEDWDCTCSTPEMQLVFYCSLRSWLNP